MKQILEEKLNKTFREEHFQWSFKIQKESIYGVEITASAKSWPDTLYEVILQPGQYDPFKPTDPNYPIIIDPLNGADAQTVDVWKECYEIARVAVNKEIENPTSATHFHGIGTPREWFEENVVPSGKFLKKVGDTYFYWSPN